MSVVCFKHLTRRYGDLTALDNVDLVLEEHGVAVLCGPPRSGKSVLLRLLVGLEAPDAGRVLIDGKDVTSVAAGLRQVGYVPQSFALFPHMTVRDNIGYPLRTRGVSAADIARRVDRISEPLRIGSLLGKRPDQLSGGEKQRAAIARGTLQDARVFALDDPLVGLDFKLRESLMDDLKDMRESLGATFVYATSDPLEALTMGDQIAILDKGRLIETGSSERVYFHPLTLRGAELVGFPRCNVVAGAVYGARCTTPLATFAVPASGAGDVDVVVRPEDVEIDIDCEHAAYGTVEGVGQVTLVENLGAECVVYLDVGETRLVSTPPSDAARHLAIGSDVRFRIKPESMTVFDRRDGTRLGGYVDG